MYLNKKNKIKGFTLSELLTVSLIATLLSVSAYFGYSYYIKKSVISVLSNAVMTDVQIIDSYYLINGIWVTDVDPENPNLTTDKELKEFGLTSRSLGSEFIMRVFKKQGYPNVIAREEIGHHKYKIRVSYHFLTRKLLVEHLK